MVSLQRVLTAWVLLSAAQKHTLHVVCSCASKARAREPIQYGTSLEGSANQTYQSTSFSYRSAHNSTSFPAGTV